MKSFIVALVVCLQLPLAAYADCPKYSGKADVVNSDQPALLKSLETQGPVMLTRAYQVTGDYGQEIGTLNSGDVVKAVFVERQDYRAELLKIRILNSKANIRWGYIYVSRDVCPGVG